MSDPKVSRIIALLNELKRGNNDNFEEFYELTKYQIFYSLLSLTKNHELAEGYSRRNLSKVFRQSQTH